MPLASTATSILNPQRNSQIPYCCAESWNDPTCRPALQHVHPSGQEVGPALPCPCHRGWLSSVSHTAQRRDRTISSVSSINRPAVLGVRACFAAQARDRPCSSKSVSQRGGSSSPTSKPSRPALLCHPFERQG